MGGVDLRYVNQQRDRRGRVAYWYFRRAGRRWRLPGQPGSPEFMAEYARLKTATEPANPSGDRAWQPGSLGALVDDYFASPEFRDRKPNTQRIYRIVLEPIAERMGRHQVRQMERRHVKALRDERADTPGMANMVVKVMRLLLSYAVDNNWRPDNPATRVKTFKLGEHRAWTNTELGAFERRWAPGTMERRAYMLARYTGQRRGDLAAMTKAHRQGGFIDVKQEKTDTELTLREHRELAAELARGDQSNMSLLVGPDGAAFDPDGLGRWFASAIDAAGLPDECVLHGLRKVAAKSLADAGCTAHEIMAITGHKSLTEVQRYTEAASQRTGATAAIHKLENARRTPSGKRRFGRVANRSTDA